MKCKKCNYKNKINSKYCKNCGEKINKSPLFLIILFIILIILLIIFILNIINEKTLKTNPLKSEKIVTLLEKKATDTSSNWDDEKNSKIDETDPLKNFKVISHIKDQQNKIIAIIKNANQNIYNLKMNIEYYDENNKLIDTKEQVYYNLIPSHKFVIEIQKYQMPEKFNSYKINLLSAEKVTYEKEETTKYISIKSNDDGKNIKAIINNKNENKDIYLEICLLYYYDKKLLTSQCKSTTAKKNSTTEIKYNNYYFDKKYKGFIFDNYKLIINNY